MRIEAMEQMPAQQQQAMFDERRRRALDCLRLAQKAEDEIARAELVTTTQKWLQLAVKPYLSQPCNGRRIAFYVNAA